MGYSLNIRNVNKMVKVRGKNKVLLDNVSFDIGASEFVAIVGVSGAGKTTLLNVLSGYNKINSGNIYVNDDNITVNRDYYQDRISYVPQKEVLHNHLTLKRSLYYSASLRMPGVSKKERLKRVENVIEELELTGKENTLIKNLSGGERKRASIATELLTTPDILLLDEPTSGLDSNIEKKLMKTLKNLRDSGTTVVITAHTVSNLYMCDKIIFMSDGGKICYIGKFKDSLKYFEVEEFVDIYEKLKDVKEAQKYQNKYSDNSLEEIKNKKSKPKNTKKVGFLKEISYLSGRYVETIFNNRLFCFLLLFQAIIMGISINIVAESNWLKVYDTAKILLFAFSCAAMWLGLFNSVQEIVKERDIIKLEYFNNMRLSSYIISKLLVFAVLCFIQAILFLCIISMKVEFPEQGIIFNSVFLEYTLGFFLVSFSSTMLGMLISALVKTTEITLIITPIYMMFQLLFSGVLVTLNGISKLISHFIIGRYAIEAFGTTSNLINVLENTMLGGIIDTNTTTIMFIDEAKEYYTYTVSHFNNLILVLVGSILLFMVLSIIAIRYNVHKVN